MTLTAPATASERARALVTSSVVWDMVFVYEPEMENAANLFDRYLNNGVTFISVHPAGDRHTVGEAMHRIARCRADILAHPRTILATTVDDVLRAKREGKLAVGLHLEGFRCLERDLAMIEVYHQLGVRFVHPIFNLINEIGGGCADRYDIGLTQFGVKVVKEMNRQGILVDAAHCGYKASLDMMEVSEVPVIFSHLACYALRKHIRNVRDDQIKLCAQKGGMIGITSAGFYLGDTSSETYFRHLDYVAQMVGPEFVGFGLDFLAEPALAHLQAFIDGRPDEWPGREEGAWKPMACFGHEQTPEVVDLMLNAGYSDAAVTGILGGNWMRICGQVWKK
jgi:membrane dipeptidase